MIPHHHSAIGFLAAALGYGGMLMHPFAHETKEQSLLRRLDYAEGQWLRTQEQRRRDAPIISAADAKRERKRLKRMRDAQ